jgi:hypothetical protein
MRLLAPLALAAVTLTATGADEAARPLFNGRDLTGWQKAGDWQAAATVATNAANPKIFSVQPGEGVLVNGTNGHTANLRTEESFGDVEAHLEFTVPKDSNSGVYFLGRYEVQILDSFGKRTVKSSDCGGIYASCSEPQPQFPGRPPSVNASRAPGEWQSYDIVFRAPRFDAAGRKTENARFVRVVHNGQVIHENVEVPRPTCAALALDEKATGPLLLQGDHGPVAYRNLRVRRIALK